MTHNDADDCPHYDYNTEADGCRDAILASSSLHLLLIGHGLVMLHLLVASTHFEFLPDNQWRRELFLVDVCCSHLLRALSEAHVVYPVGEGGLEGAVLEQFLARCFGYTLAFLERGRD